MPKSTGFWHETNLLLKGVFEMSKYRVRVERQLKDRSSFKISVNFTSVGEYNISDLKSLHELIGRLIDENVDQVEIPSLRYDYLDPLLRLYYSADNK